jgi:cobalt/nickel transport system permease protein
VGFILAVSLLPIGGYAALVVAFAGVVTMAVLARLGPLMPARRALLAAPFLLAALPIVFTNPGLPIGAIDLGLVRLNVSGDGLRLFTTIALKSWISVQAALLLAFTTPFHDLVDALRALRLPKLMVSIISFMYRYLGVLGDEGSRLLRARASRSAALAERRAGGSLRWRASVTGAMVGSLFLRSYERSERIYAAMQARGFEGQLRHIHAPPLSRAQIAAFIALALAVVALEVAGHLLLPRL